MPFELKWEPRGIYRRFFGTATIADRRESVELICADPRFDSLRYSITDYLGIDGYESSRQATKEIAALHIGAMRTNPNIFIATVAVDTEVVAAVEYFISLGFIKQPQRIFDSVDSARAWISESHPLLKLRPPPA